jgi:hypothetical protein
VISKSDAARIDAARQAAHQRGYMLLVDQVPNLGALTHAANAAPVVANQPSMGRHLTYGTSAVEAAEAGLDVLVGILDNGDPWPDP